LNPIQWNALAIVFVVAIMPFAIAFITNAGSSSEGTYNDSLPEVGYGSNAGSGSGSYWINNGGDNHTAEYVLNDPIINGTYYENCVYVVDGYCIGYNRNAMNKMPIYEFNTIPTNDWTLPMTSTAISGSHYYGDPSGAYYFGSSGDGPFTMLFNPNYLKGIEQGTGLDKLKFTFVDNSVDYSCSNAIFNNISFNADITFYYGSFSQNFNDFNFDTSNKYEYRTYVRQHLEYQEKCHIGFQVEFDFTGFESLELSSLNNNDWSNTSFKLNFENFKNKDRPGSFADTSLPFACNCVVKMGIEHQEVNSAVAGFIIRTGTLLLSGSVAALAVASTRQWNPLTTFIGGILP
jgi:hypothetical protein